MALLSDFRDQVGIVISSCDAFFDAWQPFASFFEKFWSDCPLRVYLLTNRLSIRSKRIEELHVGEDAGWSSNLMHALERIPHPYFLYFQEDYFLTGPVHTDQLAEDVSYVIGSGAESLCFRARSEADPGTQKINNRFGVVPLDSDGRTRCQVTLWKKNAFRSILREGETAWDFEARGSARTQQMQILSYLRRENTPVPYLMSAISRGLWMPEALALCREHDVAIEPFFRPEYSKTSWRRRLRRAVGRSRLKHVLREAASKTISL